MEKKSTVTNLTTFGDFVASNLGDGSAQVDVIYTDILKAYDKLAHDVLLGKLVTFGFDPKFVKFIASYLRDRELRVRFETKLSEPYYPTSSVIQGSKLSSLFFAIVIDGIGNSITHSHYLLFADDFKIFRTINSLEDCQLLQDDLDSVCRWLSDIKLTLHPDKCEVMSTTRKRTTIENIYFINDHRLARVQTKKDLGVIFQSNFKFDQHINSILSAANRTLGLILRHSKYFDDIDTITTLYTALVRSKLEYAAIIWTPKHKFYIKNIEQVQKRFVRVLFLKLNGFYPSYPSAISYQTLLEALPMGSLSNRRVFYQLTFIHDIINNSIICPGIIDRIQIKVPNLSLRQRHNADYFDIPITDCPVGNDSPLVSSLTAYNRYSSIDLAMCKDMFRTECRSRLYLNTR
ncbi:hypothetical protein WDU94_005669 [Cyamophila willieti]